MTESTRRSDRKKGLLVVGMIIGLVIVLPVGTMMFRPSGDPKTEKEGEEESNLAQAIDVGPVYLDFGEHGFEENLTWTLPLRNTTDQEIEIMSFNTTCGCSEISPDSLILPPQETREVTMILDLHPQTQEEISQVVRLLRIRVTPVVRGGLPEQVEWVVSGRVINPFQFSPEFVNYGDNLVHGTPHETTEVEVHSRQPMEDISAECESTLAKVTIDRISSENQQDFKLRIEPSENLPVGDREFNVIVRGTSSKDGDQYSGGLRVNMPVLAPVTVSPRVISLGALPVGQRATREVTLKSRDEKLFEIVDIESDAQIQISPEPDSDLPNVYRVEVEGQKPGLTFGVVTFRVRTEPGADTYDLPLRVSVYGVASDDAAVADLATFDRVDPLDNRSAGGVTQ